MTLIALGLAGCVRGDEAAASPERAGARGRDSSASRTAFRAGALEIHNVVAPAPVAAGDSAPAIAVYFLVMNSGARADTLDAIEISGGSAGIHDQVRSSDGGTSMVRVEGASIPSGETLRFVPGGRHVMVEGVTRPIAPGDELPLTLVFRHAGRAPVSARIVAYADLDAVISAGAEDHTGH